MQLCAPFSFLLTGLLSILTQVEATPAKRSPSLATLPLKRSPRPADVHPAVLYQQHVNRSHRRHARMNGLEGPSDAELAKRLQKRLDLVEFPEFDKRYNRNGVNRVTVTDNLSDMETDNEKATAGQGFPSVDLAAQLSDSLTKANEPTAANSLGLSIVASDALYVATIQVGTPPRDFSIVMDSGSANFWVAGEGCKGQGGGDCGGQNRLGPNSSSTFQDTGTAWGIQYNAGFVEGNIVSDNVNITGLPLNNQVFGVALAEILGSPNPNFDGVIGLAKSSLSTIPGVLTPVESLAKQGLIKEAITSYKISRLSDGLNDGEITFGGLDQSNFDPTTLVTMSNINQGGYWEAGFTAVSVNGEDLGLEGRTAIFDTGTTFLVVPEADAEMIHAKIPGAKADILWGYLVPCTTTAVVSFTFGGQQFDINPLDLMFAPVDQNNLEGDCYSGITPGTVGTANQWLLGDVFLKNAYFSHNVDKNEISLAKLV